MMTGTIWSGNPDNLPPVNVPFEYNGNEYRWIPCPCGCGHPLAFELNGPKSFEMTVRLRGDNQGEPQAEMLVKLGKREGLIKTNGDGRKVAILLNQTLGEIRGEIATDDPAAMKAHLESKGISFPVMFAALSHALGIDPLEVFLLSFMRE